MHLAAGRLFAFRKLPFKWLMVLLISMILHLLLLPIYLNQYLSGPPDNPEKAITFQVSLQQPVSRKPPETPTPPRPKPPPIKPAPVHPPSTTHVPNPSVTVKRPAPKVFGLDASPGQSTGSGGPESGSGGGDKTSRLQKFGGSEKTEAAVRSGLEWLLTHQAADGRWDGDAFQQCCPKDSRCSSPGHPQYDVGNTALCVAAFIEFGTLRPPAWDAAIERGVAFLLRSQKKNGAFGTETASFMYNQAMATYTLAKYYPMHRAPEVSRAVESALQFIGQAQQQKGGWDYTSKQTHRNDLSITAWLMLSVDACKTAGFDFPKNRQVSAARLMQRMLDEGGGTAQYADRGIGAGKNRPGLLPAGMLGLLLCGTPPESPLIRALSSHITRSLPDYASTARWETTGQSYYYWYYGSLALLHAGGPAWRLWNGRMIDVLLTHQRQTGHLKGSWNPERNWIGQVGGRVYATAMAVLTLEIYYRISPKHATLNL